MRYSRAHLGQIQRFVRDAIGNSAMLVKVKVKVAYRVNMHAKLETLTRNRCTQA